MTIIGIILGLRPRRRHGRRPPRRGARHPDPDHQARSGLNDRLEALLQYRPEPNYAHAYLAAIWSSAAVTTNNPLGMIPSHSSRFPTAASL